MALEPHLGPARAQQPEGRGVGVDNCHNIADNFTTLALSTSKGTTTALNITSVYVRTDVGSKVGSSVANVGNPNGGDNITLPHQIAPASLFSRFCSSLAHLSALYFYSFHSLKQLHPH